MNFGFFGRWPLGEVEHYLLQQTICGKFLLNVGALFPDLHDINVKNTFFISRFKIAERVKNSLFENNLQVTKVFNSRVGTSEAIRLLSYKSDENKFNEWLGGLIDGDGSFILSKKGYASLEITMDIRDEHCLYLIKQKYGGSVKLRSGSKSLRYR